MQKKVNRDRVRVLVLKAGPAGPIESFETGLVVADRLTLDTVLAVGTRLVVRYQAPGDDAARCERGQVVSATSETSTVQLLDSVVTSPDSPHLH